MQESVDSLQAVSRAPAIYWLKDLCATWTAKYDTVSLHPLFYESRNSLGFKPFEAASPVNHDLQCKILFLGQNRFPLDPSVPVFRL